MSALRHGKIERAILAEIADTAKPRHDEAGSVLIASSRLLDDVFRPKDLPAGIGVAGGWDWGWKPAPTHRKAVTRAMHSFVGKHQQYALTGGQGRRVLYLYDTADPVSVMWAKLWVERPHGSKRSISRSNAITALREPSAAPS